MTRTGTALAGVAFVLAVALAITISGPLLLFNPWFVAFEQGRHDVPFLLAADPPTVERLTNAMLGDLFTNGDFGVSRDAGGPPLLDAEERSHMGDVGGVVRGLLLVDVVAVAGAVLLGRRLRANRELRGRLLLSGSAAVGVAAIVLGLGFAFAFDAAFAAFHALFFAAGTWQFGPDSNLLRLFPQPFWFEIALVAGATIVVSAALVGLLGRRDLRAA